MKRIRVINGPNLNMLGVREPEIYGHETYRDLCYYVTEEAKALGLEVEFFQTNSEGELVDLIQGSLGKADGIVINPAAYTHYSVAVLDALQAVDLPKVEVHLSNIHRRESFRQRCVTTAGCDGQICGLGRVGYVLALVYLLDRM